MLIWRGCDSFRGRDSNGFGVMYVLRLCLREDGTGVDW